jgi:hypothetical protein
MQWCPKNAGPAFNLVIRETMIRVRKTVLLLSFSLLVALVTCLLCEGLSSSFFVVREAITGKELAERVHTQYDEELGWINIPNLYVEDMYGPGKYVKTNSRSFRNDRDFGASVPSNKVRIICSGDSFTFGYGVDNAHTWCQLIENINQQLETVNMGQGGYGIDQSYLWYKRDGTRLDHDIHLFTFITDDFVRMQSSRFLGYGKPVIELQDGAITTTNVPVPQRAFYAPWLIHALRSLNGLASIRLSQDLFYQGEPGLPPTNHQAREVVLSIIEDLQQTNQAKHSNLVLVYLPTIDDYTENTSDSWRQFLLAEAAKNNWPFIDLIDEFRNVPPQKIGNLFITEAATEYYGAAGHYSEEGNAYIANILYEKLMEIPQISDKLQHK